MKRPKIIGIYKITSPIGKVYIGQSRDIYRRFLTHYWSKSKRPLTNSIKTYGWDAHEAKILLELPYVQALLDQYEIMYIDLYRSRGIELFNLNDGGKFAANIRTPEIREKISRSLKGVPKSLETIAKFSAWQVGKKLSKEHIEKISIARRKIIVDTKTGNIYRGIAEAAKAYGCSIKTISGKLSGKIVNNTNLIFG